MRGLTLQCLRDCFTNARHVQTRAQSSGKLGDVHQSVNDADLSSFAAFHLCIRVLLPQGETKLLSKLLAMEPRPW